MTGQFCIDAVQLLVKTLKIEIVKYFSLIADEKLSPGLRGAGKRGSHRFSVTREGRKKMKERLLDELLL